jgi:hypothetical protein
LRERGVGGAPVVDDDGSVIGAVTDGDLMAPDADPTSHYIQFLDSVIYPGARASSRALKGCRRDGARHHDGRGADRGA